MDRTRTFRFGFVASLALAFSPHVAAARRLPSADSPHFAEESDGGRPRCLPASGGNLFFSWDEGDKFERRLYVRRSTYGCAQWRKALIPSPFRRWTELVPGTNSALGIQIPPATLRLLRQVRAGASQIRAEDDAESYLRNHPLQDFSFAANRDLTKKHGMDFAAAVYRAWLEAKPGNAALRAEILNEMARLKESGSARAEVDAKSGGVVVLASLGLGMSPDHPDSPRDMAPFFQSLPSYAQDLRYIRNDPFAGLRGNLETHTRQIREVLATGKDVILLTLSKGTPEALWALAKVTAPYAGRNRNQSARPAGFGKVRAVVAVSPLATGSFLADFYNSIYGHSFSTALLSKIGRSDTDKIARLLRQVETLSTPEVERLNAEYMGSLPIDLPYVNVVGICGNALACTSGNGKTEAFRTLERRLRISKGANDGLIEYPGAAIPEWATARQRTLVIDGPHNVIAGSFGSYAMRDDSDRRNFFSALFLHVLK